jgi:hypothetical protein
LFFGILTVKKGGPALSISGLIRLLVERSAFRAGLSKHKQA